MALLLIEGFDIQASADLSAAGWVLVIGAQATQSGGRRSTRALTLSQSAYASSKSLNGNYSTLVAGFAFMRANATSDHTFQLFAFYDGAPSGSNTTSQMAVRLNTTTGFLSVYRGNTLLATDNFPTVVGQYYYIEFKVVFHAGAGSYELRIAGQTRLTGAGVATISSANAYANHVMLGSYSSANGGNIATINLYYDDIYVCDDSGSINNDFLGDCRVDTVVPVAEGAFSDFTPSTGTDNSALVDELTLGADYVSSNVLGHKDTYNMSDLLSLSDSRVFGVMPIIHANVEEAGSRALAPLVRSGGSNYEGGWSLLNTSAKYISTIFDTNPNGAVAWTQASVNAAEFGVIVKI